MVAFRALELPSLASPRVQLCADGVASGGNIGLNGHLNPHI